MRVFQMMLLALVLFISVGNMWADPASTFPCPSTGAAQYCNQIIVINGDGSVTIFDSTPGNSGGYSISATPYDNTAIQAGEDQLIGVVDLLGGNMVVNSLDLTGNGIFNFDGDGANSGANNCVDTGAASQYGCNGATNTLDAANPFGLAGAGYAGFVNINQRDVYFTNYNPASFPANSGTVNFDGGLQFGDTAWFSLEGETSTAFSVAKVTQTSTTTPEPGSLWFLAVPIALGAAVKKLRPSPKKPATVN